MTPFVWMEWDRKGYRRCNSGDIFLRLSVAIPHRNTAGNVWFHTFLCRNREVFTLFRKKLGQGWWGRKDRQGVVYRKGVWFWPPNFGYFFSLTLSHFFWDNFVGQIVGQGCQEGSDFSRIKWVHNFCLVFILFYYFCPKIPLLSQKKKWDWIVKFTTFLFSLVTRQDSSH